jgi:uncharacterized protein YndB with AHSA1/START domain
LPIRIALPGSVANLLSPAYAGDITKVRSVSVSRLINAPASTIFELLADPRRHHELDGSSSVINVRKAPVRLFLGAKFSMDMKIRVPYSVRNTVSAFEESRLISWHHFAQFVWRYDLEEVPDGTRVTESFNYDRPWAFVIIWLGWPERNRRAMEATLERINDIVTQQR